MDVREILYAFHMYRGLEMRKTSIDIWWVNYIHGYRNIQIEMCQKDLMMSNNGCGDVYGYEYGR